MTIPAWVQTTVGAVLAFAFGAADGFYFHKFGDNVDLLFVMGGLAALGINVAYIHGKATPP